MALDAAMPQIPPALAALFAQRMNASQAPGTPGSPAITPPAMTPGPTAPMRTVFGMPQGTGMFQKPAAPAPSDDPAIAQARLTPQEKDLTGGSTGANALNSTLPSLPDTSALTAERQKAADLETKIAGIKSPTPEEYKPSWWRRLLSIPLATAAGLNNPAAGAEASDTVLYGPYHRAQAQYQAQVSPLQKQLEYERSVGVPMAESEARLAQENFTNQMAITREKREQTAFENETGEKTFQETGADGQVHYFQRTKGGQKVEVPEPREQAEDRRRREEDANTMAPGARPEKDPANPGKYRVKTKSGGYVPWSPKTPEEGAMIGDPTATRLFNQEHPGKENPNSPNQNGYTPGEQREINQRTRASQARVNNLERTRSLLVGSPDKEDQAQLKALDAEIAAEHAKMDAIENEVMGRRQTKGGSAAAGGTFKIPKGAPPAKGVPDGHQLKQNGKVIAVAKGGQWVAPNPGGAQ